MKKALIAYVPVLHDGYRKLFLKHADADTIYIFGDEIIARFEYLKKEIRALEPRLMKDAIASLKIGPTIELLNVKTLKALQKTSVKIVMSDEDVTHELKQKFFKNKKVTFDPIFLRWDKHNAAKEVPVVPEERISRRAFDKRVMANLEKEALKSSDWWRRIAAMIIKGKKVLAITYNHHLPSEYAPYINGDPRNAFKKGTGLDLYTSIHAEAGAIAEAARQGEKLEGTTMYVTVFPCPHCAKLIAFSGIKTLYCGGGYGVLDGEDVLKTHGVKIIFVEQNKKGKKLVRIWKGYTKE